MFLMTFFKILFSIFVPQKVCEKLTVIIFLDYAANFFDQLNRSHAKNSKKDQRISCAEKQHDVVIFGSQLVFKLNYQCDTT